MGFFGAYLFSGVGWSEFEPDDGFPSGATEPWLTVEIHDSDFATIRYLPVHNAVGIAYLGITPRIYFDDETASEPTEPRLESEGLTQWAAVVVGDQVAESDRQQAVLDLLARDEEPSDDEADADVDDSEIFVELKAAKLLRALGLSLPDELADIER